LGRLIETPSGSARIVLLLILPGWTVAMGVVPPLTFVELPVTDPSAPAASETCPGRFVNRTGSSGKTALVDLALSVPDISHASPVGGLVQAPLAEPCPQNERTTH
jgi:hypothetical protein